MKVLIPMAGTGNRFVQAGYQDPKPLINVGGKRIIEYILDMFDEKDEIVFICNTEHLSSTKCLRYKTIKKVQYILSCHLLI